MPESGRSPHTGSSHANPTTPTFHFKGSRARLRGAAPCQKAGAARTLDPVMQIPLRMPPPQRIADPVTRSLATRIAGSVKYFNRSRISKLFYLSGSVFIPVFSPHVNLRRTPSLAIASYATATAAASAAASASASACSASYSAIQSLGTTRTMRRTPLSCKYLWRQFCANFLPRADSDAAP